MIELHSQAVEATNQIGGGGIEQMPRDIKEKIVSYLAPLEISNLLSASRQVQSDVTLSTTAWPCGREYPITRCFHRGSERGGATKRCFGVVVPEYSAQYHSISLNCDWFDGSWKEQQAQLYIVSHSRLRRLGASECAEATAALPFDCGTVVAKSSVIRFYKTTTILSFTPKPDKVYQLWCYLGMGSHHAITLENINIIGLSYGDEQPNFEVYCPRSPIHEEENTGRVRNSNLRPPSLLDDHSFLYPDFKIA